VGMQHTGIHLLRSVVEGILLNAYWIASSLIKLVGKPESIIASGRLLEIDWICQATADIFGIPVYVSNEGDASTIGAIWLAEIAGGVRKWDDIQLPKENMAIYHPDEGRHSFYQTKFEQFQKYALCMQTSVNPN
jgi:gluconokinase